MAGSNRVGMLFTHHHIQSGRLVATFENIVIRHSFNIRIRIKRGQMLLNKRCQFGRHHTIKINHPFLYDIFERQKVLRLENARKSGIIHRIQSFIKLLHYGRNLFEIFPARKLIPLLFAILLRFLLRHPYH